MRKLFYAAAAVAAMVAGSTSANATVLVANPTVLVPPGSASFGSGQITNPNFPAPPGSGASFLFNDQIQFTLGGLNPALADSSLITFLLSGSQNISFACPTCSLYLDTNVDGFRFVQTQFDPQAEAWQLNPISISPGLHTIFANGVLFGPTGSYGGTINVQAIPNVPEPATWALMLLGFGAVGWQLRRRRRPALIQAA